MPRQNPFVQHAPTEGGSPVPSDGDPGAAGLDLHADAFADFDVDGEQPAAGDPFDAILEQSDGGGEQSGGEVDLRPDQRVAIETAVDGIENKTFYEVMLLPRSADARAIKRAYYKLSKEYHPDKFYRKQLGEYKLHLETIFNKINEAYRVLSDDEARADYDAMVFGTDGPEPTGPAEATTTVDFVPDAVRKAEAAKKAKETARGGRSRKKKRSGDKPEAKFITDFRKQLATRIAKARKHMTDGKAAMNANQFGEAASHFQMAMTLDARNETAKNLFKKAQTKHRNEQAQGYYKQAQDALLAEDHRRAAQFMQKAVDCKPTKGKYYNEFGKLIIEHTLQQKVGLELLRKAVETESRSLDYTMDLARAYQEMGMPTNAARAYERALQLNPKNSEATKALKRLK